MGIFDFFNSKKKIIEVSKKRLKELNKLWDEKYPEEWWFPKLIICEDGTRRYSSSTDWGIVKCCINGQPNLSIGSGQTTCSCKTVEVTKITFEGQFETTTDGLTNLPRKKYLPYNKQIKTSMIYNRNGERLNTKQKKKIWKKAAKEKQQYNDLESEIKKLKDIIGYESVKDQKPYIRYNNKPPKFRDLRFINDSCFDESGNGFTGLIDDIEFVNGSKLKDESSGNEIKAGKLIKDRKFGSEFKNVKALISYIEANKKIIIKVVVYENWGGWYQLKNSKLPQSKIDKDIYDSNGDLALSLKIENGEQIVEFGEGYDVNYDFKKNLIEGKFYIWGIGVIIKEKILSMLYEYTEEKDEDTLEDFFNYYVFCNEVEEALESFNITEFEIGKGAGYVSSYADIGVDDISWCVGDNISNFRMELVIN